MSFLFVVYIPMKTTREQVHAEQDRTADNNKAAEMATIMTDGVETVASIGVMTENPKKTTDFDVYFDGDADEAPRDELRPVDRKVTFTHQRRPSAAAPAVDSNETKDLLSDLPVPDVPDFLLSTDGDRGDRKTTEIAVPDASGGLSFEEVC